MLRHVRRLAPGVTVILGCAVIARLSDPVRELPITLAACALATAGWLLGWADARRHGLSTGLRGVIAVALLSRLLLILPETPLSDDLYRYVWDGRVGNAGTNPYRYAPDAEALRPLRDDVIWPRVNHPHLPTLYPPVAQLYFRGLAVAGSPRAPRVGAALLDVTTVALLARLLRQRGRPAALALVYGWCPLAILESGGAGHVDALGVAALAAGLLALTRATPRSAITGGLLLSASALVKPAAVLLAPMLLARSGARRGWILAGAAIALLTAAPYLGAGARLFSGFRTYAENWHFNDALFSRLVAAGVSPHDARRMLGVTLAAVALLVPWKLRDPLRGCAVVLGAFLALSPTVHPWYALWLLALLPFAPAALVPAAATLCALLPLAYVTPWARYATGEWNEPPWMRNIIWGSAAGVLAAALVRRRFAAVAPAALSPARSSGERA